MRKKSKVIAFLLAAAMGLTASLAAQLLLRNISVFLAFDPQFQRIFAQIRTASMDTPVWLLIAIACMFSFPVVRFCRSTAARVLAILGGVVLWVLLLATGAFLTRVNDVLFGDVLVSLLDVIRKGGLDGL